MGMSLVARGIIGWLCLYALLGLAEAQTLRTFDVINGDFDDACGSFGSDPQHWVYQGQCNRGHWRNSPSFGGRIDGPSVYVDTNGQPSNIVSENPVDMSSTLTVADTQDATFVLPYTVKFRYDNDDTGLIKIIFRDAVGSNLGEFSSGLLPAVTTAQADSMTHPFVTGVLPQNTQQFDIELQCVTGASNNGICGTIWDNLGPLAVTINDTGGGDGGDGDPPVNVEVNIDLPTVPDVQDAINQAQQLVNQACGTYSEATSLVGLVPDAWGGAGFGGQLAQIAQGIQDLCYGEVQTENAVEQTDAMTGPDPYTRLPTARPYADPLAPSVGVQWDNFTTNYDAGDDLISAQVRQTELIRASTAYQMAQWDRTFGTGTPRQAYETEGGPKMDESIIGNEPNIEFAEGNYGQTYGRLNALIDDAALEPDFGSRIDLDGPVSAATGAGVCMAANVAPPSGSGLGYATQVLKWNAAQKLGGSPIGAWVCELIDNEVTVPSSICFGTDASYSVGGAPVVSANGMCIYGGNAGPWWNYLWSVMPGILLLAAGLGVFKLFF